MTCSCMGGLFGWTRCVYMLLVVAISDYTAEYFLIKSKRFGTYASAFFSANDKKKS